MQYEYEKMTEKENLIVSQIEPHTCNLCGNEMEIHAIHIDRNNLKLAIACICDEWKQIEQEYEIETLPEVKQ